MRQIRWLGLIGFAVIVLITCDSDGSKSLDDNSAVLFVHEVLPIIQANCLNCHGNDPDKIEGGLRLDSRAAFLRGGEQHSELVVAGRPDFSPIYQAIKRGDPETAMPPREREALSEEEVQSFHDWIVAGAEWPTTDEQADLLAISGSKSARLRFDLDGQSVTWNARTYRENDLWSYQQLVRPEIPAKDMHPIDAFINGELWVNGIKPAEAATLEDLIRRASYDLTGLPPSQEITERFLREQNFDQLIDSLLASPHYGERMATHWLDVARYADSDGFSNDYSRPNAWRYRDYVIRSFNLDKPFDQFLTEQLAGDELDPNNPEYLIATGFLRMGPWEHTGMSVAAETRQYYLDDITNSVGETFMATPLNCARCHDHKYDPIPTKDYYRVQAVFATTQFAQREVPFESWENTSGMEEQKERIEAWLKRIDVEQKKLLDKEERAARDWYSTRGLPYLTKKKRRKLSDQQQPPRYHGLTFEDLGYRKVLSKRRQIEQRKLNRFKPIAFSTYSGPTRTLHSARPMPMPDNITGEAQPTFVLNGGSVYAADEEVSPGALQIVHRIDTSSDHSWHSGDLTGQMGGRRLDFAKWLTHPANPITARVIANRIWQWHMGDGLAANENNFGATGSKPSHPKLLDWLAVELMEHNWSIKHLHRVIMSSETYQRSYQHSDKKRIQEIDPDNRLLSYFPSRRLTAEEIRDGMLMISGELNTNLGGLPIRPEIPLSVALQPRHTMGSAAPSYQPSRTPDQRNRRSIYIERLRSIANPLMQTFNQAGSEISCEEREASTVVNQAFGLLNSRHTRSRSLHLAQKLWNDGLDDEQVINQVYQHVLQRGPDEEELTMSLQYLASMQRYHQENEPEPFLLPSEVTHEMHEEMTGVAFHYTEYLDVHDDYEYDLTDAQTSPKVRALADVATVLFNTNEFLYVY